MADPSQVDEMIREIQALAEREDWKTWSIEELKARGSMKSDGLRGISVSLGEGCDAFHFHIDESGQFTNYEFRDRMSTLGAKFDLFGAHMQVMMSMLTGVVAPIQLERLPPPKPDGEEQTEVDQVMEQARAAYNEQGLRNNWAQTQGGGAELHVKACELLRFVRDRFAPELEVIDGTGYFEHGRIEEVQSQMAVVNDGYRRVVKVMERIKTEGGLGTPADLLTKLTDYMDNDGEPPN